MIPARIRAICTFLVLFGFAAVAAAAPAPDVQPNGRTCGTAEPTRVERDQVLSTVGRFRAEHTTPANGGTIRVAFHVITSGKKGQVTDAQIAAQIDALNRAYRGAGYKFELASVDRTDNGAWFKMGPGGGSEAHAKQALAIDPAHYLNLYTASLTQQLLGWAYFPNSIAEDSYWHGVVVHFESLPGGGFTSFNLGGTAAHEVGHYLGLYHTFQGGCVAPGDEVDDTPFEASPASGCPIGRDTCEQPGFDPVQNYMDYSDDACYSEFTAGQEVRMNDMVSVYRPSLFESPLANSTGNEIQPSTADADAPARSLSFRGASPNPFRYETAIHFTLPVSGHVSLKVYDIAGKLVSTLVDAPLPPGDHSAMFRSNSKLPSGMYFTVLRVGGVQVSRSVVLTR